MGVLRVEDLRRHLIDLRDGAHEGAASPRERETVFREAVRLLDPVVREVMSEADDLLLGGVGDVDCHVGPDCRGGSEAVWALSWPEQLEARIRPVQVGVCFSCSLPHPELRGSDCGTWPVQVVCEEDAQRYAVIVAAIVEAELHQRVHEAGWQVLPAALPLPGHERPHH